MSLTHRFSLILHMFPFLHWVLVLWNPLQSSLGSRAKTATLSLLYQTGVKSANRLLWPNVIKLQPGSGQFTVRQFCLSRVSCISTEQQLSILLLFKKSFHYYQAWIGRILWNSPIVKSLPHSFLQLVAQWKWWARMVLFIRSQCGVPPAARHRGRAKCVRYNTSVQMVGGHHTDSWGHEMLHSTL